MPQDHVVRVQPDLTDEGRWEVIIEREARNGHLTQGLPFNFATQEEAREVADAIRPFVTRYFERQAEAIRERLGRGKS
jgi:hypothetical protein